MKEKTKTIQNKGTDIIELILDDHRELKRLIKILKDPKNDIGERYAAFGEFSTLLIIHSRPEEQTLYHNMKIFSDTRIENLEGEIEHSIAERLLQDAKYEEDEDLWSAKVKVLAEVVEHHIKKEETHFLPDYQKVSDLQFRIKLGNDFIILKEKVSKTDPFLQDDEDFMGTHLQ